MLSMKKYNLYLLGLLLRCNQFIFSDFCAVSFFNQKFEKCPNIASQNLFMIEPIEIFTLSYLYL